MRRNVRGHARQRGMSVWQTLIVLLVIGVGLSIVVAIDAKLRADGSGW